MTVIQILEIVTVILFNIVWNCGQAIFLADLTIRFYRSLTETCRQVKERRCSALLAEQVELLMLADYQQLRQKVKELELETSALRSSAFGDRRKPTLALALAHYQLNQ